MSTTTKPTTAERVRETLALNPGGTPSELAALSGLSRATISKELATLKKFGDATVVEGGHRKPGRWTLIGQTERPRLRPGELDGLVLEHLSGLTEPASPTAVGNALDRSAGAVANCMARLAKAGQLEQTSKKPRRYTVTQS